MKTPIYEAPAAGVDMAVYSGVCTTAAGGDDHWLAVHQEYHVPLWKGDEARGVPLEYGHWL